MNQDWKQQLHSEHEAAYTWALTCLQYNAADAEDVLQSVYLKIYEGRAVFKGQSALRSWLFSLIRYTAVDHLRKKQSWRRWFSRSAVEVEEVVEEPKGKRAVLEALLVELSDRQREVLYLVFFQGMILEEAAEVLDMNLGTLRTHYQRGKKALRKLVEQREELKEYLLND